mmetsp:Transcript_42897/g.49741  ORF Transcript_42897/g.49741 Transcript_42897/m.49741 type:complete len:281 (-) Transcript_42897:82-924(-)
MKTKKKEMTEIASIDMTIEYFWRRVCLWCVIYFGEAKLRFLFASRVSILLAEVGQRVVHQGLGLHRVEHHPELLQLQHHLDGVRDAARSDHSVQHLQQRRHLGVGRRLRRRAQELRGLLRVRPIDRLARVRVAAVHRVDVAPVQIHIPHERPDVLVLAEEVAQVNDEILDDREVGQRAHRRDVLGKRDARQAVDAVDVHRAASAHSFAARRAEGEAGVLMCLDGGQQIQHHEILLLVELIRLDTLVVRDGIESDDLQQCLAGLLVRHGVRAPIANHLRLV